MQKITNRAIPPPRFIKVGLTIQSIKKRLSDLNGGNPYQLKCVATWKVTDVKQGEKVAHYRLDRDESIERTKHDYGGGSEWFIVKKGVLSRVYRIISASLYNHKLLASASENIVPTKKDLQWWMNDIMIHDLPPNWKRLIVKRNDFFSFFAQIICNNIIRMYYITAIKYCITQCNIGVVFWLKFSFSPAFTFLRTSAFSSEYDQEFVGS